MLERTKRAPMPHPFPMEEELERARTRVIELETRLAQLEREHANLQRRLAERQVVERAKGVLMELNGWSEERAYSWMRTQAQDRNDTLGAFAEYVLGVVAPLLRRTKEEAGREDAKRRGGVRKAP